MSKCWEHSPAALGGDQRDLAPSSVLTELLCILMLLEQPLILLLVLWSAAPTCVGPVGSTAPVAPRQGPHRRVSGLGTNAECSQSPLQALPQLCVEAEAFLTPSVPLLLRAVLPPTQSIERGFGTSCEGSTLCHCCSPSFSSLASHRCQWDTLFQWAPCSQGCLEQQMQNCLASWWALPYPPVTLCPGSWLDTQGVSIPSFLAASWCSSAVQRMLPPKAEVLAEGG